ncbi:MAG: glycoside hydrolase family 25 protein [bacterium]|nr:glycoside hydrolase family 25 protein [bacterium]
MKKYFLFGTMALFFIVAAGGACRDAGTPAPGNTTTQKTGSGTIKGIDVSHYSGNVEWAKVRAPGYIFGFAKATEGMDLLDPTFSDHWVNMKIAGIIRGAYHFYVTEDDPKIQAQFFIDHVSLEPGDLAPAVDIESIHQGTTPGLVERFKVFLDIIEKNYGVKPMIYTNTNFWNKHMNSQFGDYPLWIAQYEVKEPVLPGGWDNWFIWQWKENATIPGVEKDVDPDMFNKEKDFSQLLMK